MLIGPDCTCGAGSQVAASLDVVGHENGHGIDAHTPGGPSSRNTREFIADVFGTATEWYANESAPYDTPDWTVGETVYAPMVRRDMCCPSWGNFGGNPGGPDLYCYSDATLTLEDHLAAGIGDRWFYLLANGTGTFGNPGYTYACDNSTFGGVGLVSALQVLYNAMLMKTSASSYLNYRLWTLQAAKNLFPNDCTVFDKVRAAWNAVGVPPQPGEPGLCSVYPSIPLFYRAGDGGAVTGSVDSGGLFHNLLTVGGFTTGYTNITPVGNGLVLFYRASDGYAVTGAINSGGGFTNLKPLGGFSPGWTHITPVGYGRVLFYRASDGYAVTGAIDSSGGFTQLQILSGLSAGWSQVTPVGNGLLLFYRASDGYAVTGSVDSGGLFHNLLTVGGLTPGYTSITPVGNGVLLFYRASDGYAVTGAVDSSGGFTNLKTVGGFSTGWTHITPVGYGRVLFYRASDGYAVTGVIDSGGGFTLLQILSGLSAGWSQVTNIAFGAWIAPAVLAVPDLSEQNPSAGQQALQNAGLIGYRQPDINVSDPSDGGRIMWQSPAAGTLVSPGAVIQYEVGHWTGAHL